MRLDVIDEYDIVEFVGYVDGKKDSIVPFASVVVTLPLSA